VTVTQRNDEPAYADLSAPRPAHLRPGRTDRARGRRASPGSPGAAPMWRRLAARVIDVVAVATWVLDPRDRSHLLHLQLWSNEVTPEPWGNWFLTTITFVVCYAAYEIVFVARTGATPGKDLMGLQVVDAATGGRPSASQAAGAGCYPASSSPSRAHGSAPSSPACGDSPRSSTPSVARSTTVSPARGWPPRPHRAPTRSERLAAGRSGPGSSTRWPCSAPREIATLPPSSGTPPRTTDPWSRGSDLRAGLEHERRGSR
jgi:hypothetical protein